MTQPTPMVEQVIAERIATLTLNRPQARNCLSRSMLSTLTDHLQALGGRTDVDVIVLAAAGPVFCAGHDLKELQSARSQADGGLGFYQETIAACSALMMTLRKCPRPVIAKVQGMATAAGCQLVASCDLAVASTEARFATPGVNIGLFCSTPMVAVSRAIPTKHVMEMLLTGEPMGAHKAEALGLINRAVAADELDREVMNLARGISQKAPSTVKLGKEAFYTQLEMSVEEAYAYTSDVMVQNMMNGDACEGIGAFIDKRAPKWQRG